MRAERQSCRAHADPRTQGGSAIEARDAWGVVTRCDQHVNAQLLHQLVGLGAVARVALHHRTGWREEFSVDHADSHRICGRCGHRDYHLRAAGGEMGLELAGRELEGAQAFRHRRRSDGQAWPPRHGAGVGRLDGALAGACRRS